MRKKKVEVLISDKQIKDKVKELGKKITEDYKGKKPVLVSILKGGGFFMADLAREINLDLSIDYIEVSNYRNDTETSGNIKITKDLSKPILGKDVIVVEELIDNGLTLKAISKFLKAKGAKSVKICALLDKPSKHKISTKIDYLGFEIPDYHIVGYGIDFREQYRNLPYIGVIEEK